MKTKTMIRWNAKMKVITSPNRWTAKYYLVEKDTYKEIYEFITERNYINSVDTSDFSTDEDYRDAILNTENENIIKQDFELREVEVIDEDSEAWKMLQKIKELAKAGETKDWAIIERETGRLLNNDDTGNLQRIFAYNVGGERFYGVYGDIALGQMDNRDYDDKAIYFAISRMLRCGDLLEDVNIKEFLNTHDTSYLDRRI